MARKTSPPLSVAHLVRRGTLLVPFTLLASGCAFFSANPPLPKGAAVETAAIPRASDEFAQVVARADVFYVPADRAAWALRQESGWKLIEALHRSGRFTIAWDIIGSDQQPLLESGTASGGIDEQTIARIAFVGSQAEREHLRQLLRETGRLGIAQLALRCPREIVEKLRRREALAATERETLPSGFTGPGRQPPDGEAALNSQFIAERIVQRVRAHPEEKLLAFVERAELENENGVPILVAQKSGVRQLVLESKPVPETRTRLLTRNEHRITTRLLEIENGPPRSGGHDL